MQNINQKNKKALSTVIATLLIVLLSFVAITIVWVVVKNLISPQIVLAPKSCIDFQINAPYSLGKACYNETSKELIINLNKKYEKYEDATAATNIFFTLSQENNSSRWCCGQSCPNCKLPESASKLLYIAPIEQKPKELTLDINGCVLQTNPVVEC